MSSLDTIGQLGDKCFIRYSYADTRIAAVLTGVSVFLFYASFMLKYALVASETISYIVLL